MLVANDVLEVLAFRGTEPVLQVVFTEVLVLSMVRILRHLMEVVGVEFQGAHLLSSRKVVAMIHEVVILMLGVRGIAICVLREVFVFVVHWLLLYLIEVFRVKLKGAKLLAARQMMSMVEIVVILVL